MMNELQVFNKEVIPVYTTDEGNKVVLGRELHEKLGIVERYSKWFARMVEYGFTESEDYTPYQTVHPQNKQSIDDHIMTLDMAKHIAMIQRTPQGMAIRQKLIDLEKETAQNFGGLSKELQAIIMLDSRSMQHEKRIEALESTMTVDYEQRLALRRCVNAVVVRALGGKESNAYNDPHTRSKVYSECNRDVQTWFRVNAVGNVPRKRFDEAVDYVQNWKPSTNTAMLVQNANRQTRFA